MEEDTIAFIGGGNMASALIGGLLKAGHPPSRLLVVEPVEAQRARLMQQLGVLALPEADATLAQAAIVVWAVKPQTFQQAVAPCARHVEGALHLSVMAGIRSGAIARASGSERVVRAMPNTPALIGQGIAGLYARAAVGAAERGAIERLLAPTGDLLWVAREEDLDSVTAISGSGPAYVYYVLEAMIDSAVAMGLSEADGRTLALATLAGATALARQSGLSPAMLREQVTSKGGTTFAALQSLEADGVKAAFVTALRKAQTRAMELGDEYG